MTTLSEFRVLFWARKIFGFLLVLLLSSIFLIDPTDVNITIFVLLVILTLVYHFFKIRKLYKIVISEKGIIKVSFLNKKKEFIDFSEVEKVGLIKFDGRRDPIRGVNISSGYYESEILLKNKESILISPDYFENYKELVKSLSENLEKFNS